jgi:hypothetical protein
MLEVGRWKVRTSGGSIWGREEKTGRVQGGGDQSGPVRVGQELSAQLESGRERRHPFDRSVGSS